MSWFSKFNPAPAFPAYSGPYDVGTVDVEIPAADLGDYYEKPENAAPTVAFRIFYPCEQPDNTPRPVRWIPSPQRQIVAAFAKFLGANSKLAEIFAIFPRLIYYITIPAHRNAPLLEAPTKNKRWPVMFFSHGLAGSRNMYSHICGSLSAHGIIVIAMDHRDGSSPIQYVRATKDTKDHIVNPVTFPHAPTKETYEGRDSQLRIRTYEIALAHLAMIRVDQGHELDNLDENTSTSKKERVDVLHMFKESLDIHEPGKITWSGHSFGAATMYQLVKSTYYAPERPLSSKPLIAPKPNSKLSKQITKTSPLALLDMWGLPLHSPDQAWLAEHTLPCYASKSPGGKAVVGVLSEGFFNWQGNRNDVKRAVMPPVNYKGPEAALYYPQRSQHFSQSDFGILFPWVTEKFMKAGEPERVLKLNMRAVLQMMRNCGIEITNTSAADMEIGDTNASTQPGGHDQILDTGSNVRGWTPIPLERKMSKSRLSTSMQIEATPPEYRGRQQYQAALSEQAQAA